MNYTMIKRFYILLLAIVASVGMSYAQDPGIVSSGTKGGMSYTFYDNGLLEISGSGALPGNAFTNWDGGFGASVKNIRFAEDCEVYGLDYLWFGCYTETSQLETIEINSVAPIMFSGASGAGIFYRQDGAVTLTITAPGIVDVENEIIDNYGSPVNMIFNMPATTVFEKKWFSSLANNYAVTIPTGAKGHIPAGYSFKDPYDQKDYDEMVAHGHEDLFWESHSHLVEGKNYTFGVESTFEITAENASQIFGQATVSFQAPTEASNSEWVLWRKSDLKTFSDMSSGDQKVCKDVTVKVNNGVYDTDSGWGLHFKSLAEDGVQFVAPEGKVFKRIAILNGYGTFSDSNWSYDSNYKKWSGSANTVGFEGDICGISLIEFELGDSKPTYAATINLINAIPNPVVLTAECKAKIDAARTAYNALSAADKELVTNIATLTQAETDYAALAAAAAASVIAQIEALPTTIKLSTYFSTYNLMVAARAAYDALSAEVQAAVTNLSKLTDLEAAFAAIGGVNEKLSKPFSVGEGQVVYFSHGNLQATYNGTNWSWAFAAHQYDYIGDTSGNIIINGNGTLSGAGTVDLFGWVANSSTVLTSGVAKYGVSNSDNVGDYGLGTTETLKGDWGVAANDANIGGYNDWRILSNDEWVYLFKTRTDAASKYGYATVGGVNGVIIIPDAFTDPMKNKGNKAFIPQNVDKGYSTNVYTTGGDWEAMEAAGAVFMPAAGRRYGTTMTVNEGTGFYWSSTPMSYQASYFMGFMGSNVVPNNDRYRSHGLSVRLVSNNAPVAVSVLDHALAAVALINAIPTPVTLDDACKDAIDAARAAVDALGANASLIDDADMNKLTQAETDYADLKTAADQAAADSVIAKIAAIPQPVTLKLATRDSIESARAAYDALTADQKLLVSNYAVLEAAEAELATLNPGGGMPADALNGKFTINAGGDQIAFAKGNLQATTTDLGAHWTWGFAANQWNYLGIAVANNKITGNGTVSENGTVDLFGWSTAATYYGINNSYKAVDYIGDFVDWGPNMGAGWRTLTKDEWNYLIENNTKGRATVNDKNGYIFLPNDWSGPAFTPDPDNFTTNVYSGDDWTAMENAGAVFLPSGPARNGTYALIANDAKYSSSTSLNNDTSYVFTIYYNQSQSACTGTNRAYGCMVRLVTEGGGATPLDSAQVVKDLIEAIPAEITTDDACVKAIEDARAAYDALSEAAQGALDAATVNKLTDAEAAYAILIKAEADAVVAKINNIPQPVELKLATRDSINNARAAYEALNAYQKPMVTNYQKLLDAEAALAELNKGGSIPMDIVWDGNTGIENVSPTTTSPAYEGMTVTVGQGSSFSTYQNRLYFTFYSQPNGGFIFANENGTNITKVVIESTTALTSTMTEVDRMGSGWVISNENKTATWTGNADSVSIWKGQSFTNYWVVDKITFTVNASSTPLDSAQAVKDLIDAIPTPVEYPTGGPAIAAALVAYNQLNDAAKGALDAADVQKMTDAAIQYAALDAIAAIEAIPAEIVYDPAVKAAIETAREKYDALIDASKALVDADVVAKLTNAEQAWADLVALIEHTVTYIGKDGELKNEKVALLNIPNPAPDFNGHEFVRWDVKAGDFLEEGLRIKAVYTPIITTQPVAYDTLVYNGAAQTLIEAGVASDGHIEYRLNEGDWSAELPKADMAAAYVVDYKLVREGHEDYMAGSVTAVIAKAPVTYVAPQAYDTLAYNYNAQVLVTAGQTNDGTIEYSLDPTLLDSWSADLPQAMNAGTYAVYFRVQGDLNHFDSIAPAPVAATIAKRDIVITAPVAYDTLVYNSLTQTLAVAGSADFGSMEYTMTPDNNEGWSADMPQAVDAGTYAVYYRVQGDANHNDFAASFAATVAKAQLTIMAEDKEVEYGESAPEFTVTFNGWQGQDDASVVSDLKISSDYAVGSSVGTYAIVPGEASALNYAITYVNGALVVTKAVVSVSDAEAQTAKFADGHTGAVVLNAGTLNGIKLNDPLTHVTTAVFSSADVSEHLTITLFYELTGDAALLANYDLQPTSEVFTTEGVIIEPFLPNNTDDPEDKESKIQEGIEVYAYGYCEGDNVGLKYHLNSGNPDQYMVEFEDSRFADVDWTLLDEKGPEGVIYITVPVDVPTGDYKMTVTFRDSRFAWLESQPLSVTFHVNLPETYVRPLFDNTIVLVDTCECFTDIQWYHRADASEQWQPISGANGHYLHVEGKLTGEYFVKAKMNGVETYTCEQTDMQTLYGAETNKQAKVKAYPNPVVTTTTVSIENSDSYEHSLRIVNLMGVEVKNTTFEGNETVVDMDSYTTGNYTISVDGIVVKVLKK